MLKWGSGVRAKTAQRSAGMEGIVDSVYSLQSAAWFSDSVTSHQRREASSECDGRYLDIYSLYMCLDI